MWLLARLRVLRALPLPDQPLALVFLHSMLTGFLALLTWFLSCNSLRKTTAKNEAVIKLLCPCCSCLLLQPQSWVSRYRCCLQKCRREHVPVYGAGAAAFPHKTPCLYLRPGLKRSLLRRGWSRNRSAKVGAAGHLIPASWCFITRLPFKPGHAGWAAALLESHWQGLCWIYGYTLQPTDL